MSSKERVGNALVEHALFLGRDMQMVVTFKEDERANRVMVYLDELVKVRQALLVMLWPGEE